MNEPSFTLIEGGGPTITLHGTHPVKCNRVVIDGEDFPIAPLSALTKLLFRVSHQGLAVDEYGEKGRKAKSYIADPRGAEGALTYYATPKDFVVGNNSKAKQKDIRAFYERENVKQWERERQEILSDPHGFIEATRERAERSKAWTPDV